MLKGDLVSWGPGLFFAAGWELYQIS